MKQAALLAATLWLLQASPARAVDAAPVADAPAAAPAVSQEAQIQQMAAYLVDMLPVHMAFEAELERTPGALAEEGLDARQESCLREQVTRDALAVRKQRDVAAFAERSPADFEAGLAVLDAGAAELIRELGEASMRQSGGEDGLQFDPSAHDPAKLAAFMQFVTGPEFKALRALSGYGDFDRADRKSGASDVETMLDELGRDIATTCNIPAEFFKHG
jgi:hypothetical protein